MAVHTQINTKTISDFMSKFDCGTFINHTGITSGIENTNYCIKTTINTYVLTIFETRTNPDNIPFYISLMSHMNAKGIACPQVIMDKNGKQLHTIANKSAILISFLEGGEEKNITASTCEKIGRLLGNMHNSVLDFTPTLNNTMGLKQWHTLYNKMQGKIDPTLQNVIRAELFYQDTIDNKNHDLQKGIVHTDLFSDNVFFKNDSVSGVIDYYFSCYDTFVYDLAITVNAWCFSADFTNLDTRKAQSFFNAYQSIRPLKESEKSVLNDYCRKACLRFLVTRTYDQINTDPNALIILKDPTEYVKKLEFYKNNNITTTQAL